MGFVKWDEVQDQIPSTPAGRQEADSAVERQLTGHVLRELRKQQRLSQAQVASIMGVSQRRVSAIERGQMARTEVHTIAAYVQALGGHLQLDATVDGETTTIASFRPSFVDEAAAR